jgi:hypothetical protein
VAGQLMHNLVGCEPVRASQFPTPIEGAGQVIAVGRWG